MWWLTNAHAHTHTHTHTITFSFGDIIQKSSSFRVSAKIFHSKQSYRHKPVSFPDHMSETSPYRIAGNFQGRKLSRIADFTFADSSLVAPRQRMPHLQILRRKLSRIATNPRNSRKFSSFSLCGSSRQPYLLFSLPMFVLYSWLSC